MNRIGYFHLENPQVLIQTMAQQENFAIVLLPGQFSESCGQGNDEAGVWIPACAGMKVGGRG